MTDSGGCDVLVFGQDGTFQRSFCSEGSGELQFVVPLGVAVADGLAFVFDNRNHCVVVLK